MNTTQIQLENNFSPVVQRTIKHESSGVGIVLADELLLCFVRTMDVMESDLQKHRDWQKTSGRFKTVDTSDQKKNDDLLISALDVE